MRLAKHKKVIERYGLGHWCFESGCRVAEIAVAFKALRGMTLQQEDAEPKYLEPHRQYSSHRAEAAAFARLPGADQFASPEFYAAAEERGDWCSYLQDGDDVVSYGWYSSVSVPIDEGRAIAYSPEWVYMYKGYTATTHRGQSLHAYGMGYALAEVTGRGVRGLISYVEAPNIASLRSVDRLGYRVFGTCYSFRLGRRFRTVRTKGCVPYAFDVVATQSRA